MTIQQINAEQLAFTLLVLPMLHVRLLGDTCLDGPAVLVRIQAGDRLELSISICCTSEKYA